MSWERRVRALKRTTLGLTFFSVSVLALFGPSCIFPEPGHADAAAIKRWFALRDVQQQPREVQLALVDRIQRHLTPRELLPADGAISSGMARYFQDQVARNVHHLKRIWFETRCLQYCETPSNERMTFLHEQIDSLRTWIRALEAQHASESSGATSRAGSSWFDELAEWTRDAPAEHQRCFRQAIRDGVLCWLAIADMKDLPLAARRELAERIAAQIGPATTHPMEPPQLTFSPDEQSRLEQNAWLLAEAWFHLRAQDFATIPTKERDAFVDARIDEVLAWNLPAYLSSHTTSPSSHPKQHDSPLSGDPTHAGLRWGPASFVPLEVSDWGTRAEPELQPAVEQLLQRVQWRLLARTLPRMWPRNAVHSDSPPSP